MGYREICITFAPHMALCISGSGGTGLYRTARFLILPEAQIYDHDVTICYIVATSFKVKPFKTLAGDPSTVID